MDIEEAISSSIISKLESYEVKELESIAPKLRSVSCKSIDELFDIIADHKKLKRENNRLVKEVESLSKLKELLDSMSKEIKIE